MFASPGSGTLADDLVQAFNNLSHFFLRHTPDSAANAFNRQGANLAYLDPRPLWQPRDAAFECERKSCSGLLAG
jgi:hypothetical protein